MSSANHVPTIAFPPFEARDRIAKAKPERKRDRFLTPPPLGDVLAVTAALLIGVAVALGLSQAGRRDQVERVETSGSTVQMAAELPAEWQLQQQPRLKFEQMFMKQR